MKILAYIIKDSTPAYHRITLPLDSMEGVQVEIRNTLHTDHFKDIDIFVYNRILPEEALEGIYQLREMYGFAIGVDLDDYWHLDLAHPYYREYTEKNFAVRQIYNISNADFVTVTHERLAAAVKPYNKNVHILPNAIPQTGQFISVEKKPHEKNLTRIFWQGSNTHLADVNQFLPGAEAIAKGGLVKLVEVVVGGYVEGDRLSKKIANALTAGGNVQHCLLSALDYQNYYHLYSEADICIVPLRRSLFNGMKSNLKVLEAANLGLPVIASKVNPYLNLPVRYVQNLEKDWFKHIHELVINPGKREAEGRELKQYCAETFNFVKINEERKQVYNHYK